MLKTETAGGVVINKEGKILVVSQRGTSWSLPKGHIEPGEDALKASKREIEEESGLTDLIFIKELGRYERYMIGKDNGEDKSELKSIHLFLYRTEQMELAPKDPDNPEARWVDRNEVADLLTHPKDKEFFLGILGNI